MNTVQEIVDRFTSQVEARLNSEQLDGPVRLDPTRTVVIIPVKGRSPIHVHVEHHIDDDGVQGIIDKIALVPSLKSLIKG
jgi:hypothetical protein